MSLAMAAPHEDIPVEELVLEVRTDEYILADGIFAFEREGRYYLPVSTLAEIFDFNAAFDSAQLYLDGWYLREDNTFSVDQKNLTAYRAQNKIDLSPADFVSDPSDQDATDLYLDLDAVMKIWPVLNLSVNLQNLTLRVETTENLPFQDKIEREERRKSLASDKKARVPDAEDLPFISNPYRLIGPPAVDVETEMGWRSYERGITNNTTISGLQDLAYATADYSTSVNFGDGRLQRPEAMRLRFLRRATPDQKLPLTLKQVEVGDVRIAHRDIFANGTGGRGIVVTTSDDNPDREFDEITVDGTGPPGWEVEIYRNNELLEFDSVDERGEYRFENVTILYGNNRIRIVLYGPQGQIREEVRTYTFSGAMLRPGEHAVTAGLVDADRDFIPLSSDPRTTPRGKAASFSSSFGLSRFVTLFGSYNVLPTEDEQKEYMSAGTVISTDRGIGQIETHKELRGGEALDLRFLTEVKGVSLNMRSSFYNKLEGPAPGEGAFADKQETDIQATTALTTFLGTIGLQAGFNRRLTEDGRISTDFRTRQSFGRGGIQVTHSTTSSLQNNHHTQSSGDLNVSARLRKWRLRGSLDYAIHPRTILNFLDTELRYDASEDLSFAFNAQHDYPDSITSAGVQVGYDFDTVLASLNTDWTQDSGWEVILRATTSLGRYSSDGKYGFSSENQKSTTALKGQVFLDKDSDGIFGDDDEALSGVRLNIDGRRSRDLSDNSGGILVTGGRDGVPVAVQIDGGSLSDPYQIPGTDGFSTVLRPGSVPLISLPVIETGAVDGTVYYEATSKPVSGMRILLINDQGEIADETETAFDGFYAFEFVRPGTYQVQADPTYGVNIPPKTVTVVSEDPFASGIDLPLWEQAKETEGGESMVK